MVTNQDAEAKVQVYDELPNHLIKKYGIVDPGKVEKRDIPIIDPANLVPKPRITRRYKSHDEIPRIDESKIVSEIIPEDEMLRNEAHDWKAIKNHRYYYQIELKKDEAVQQEQMNEISMQMQEEGVSYEQRIAHQAVLDQLRE